MPLQVQNNTDSLSDCSEGTPPKTVSVHKIKNIINILIKIAKNSAVNQRHSAALIKGDEIYNIGFNKYCSNAKYSTVHAEIDALLTFNKKYIKGIGSAIAQLTFLHRI
jgi:hypothetical protein